MIPALTLKSGNKIPRLGLGTWTIGGGMTRDPLNDDVGQIKSIRYAINQGITWIRTAQNYAEGHCEELVGEAIKGMDREKIFLMVAVNQRFAKNEQEMVDQARGSLRRLGTTYANLYLIGGLEETVSLRTVAQGLMKVKKLGLAKDVGVGNYRLSELKKMHEYLGEDLVYNEMHMNLVIREPLITGVYDYCTKNNITLGAYRPLQLGQLANPGIEVLDTLSKKYNRSQAEISLKWIMSFPNIVTMPKMGSIKHIDQSVRIFDWEMAEKDLETLTNNFPIQVGVSDCTPPKPSFTR